VAFVKITKFEDGVLKTVNATSDEIEFKGGKVNNDLIVEGNLIVRGESTVLYPESVNIADNHLFINAGYELAQAQTGGIVVNYSPTELSKYVEEGGFTAGTSGVSNPAVAVSSAVTAFAAGDIVQVSGAGNDVNNGIFEVYSHVGDVLTIKGIGLYSCVEAFTQNQFVTDTSVQGTITKVNIAVLQASTSGDWQYAKGSSTPFTFTGLTGGSLLASNNLSDLDDASAARTNLGLGSAAESAASDFLAVASNLSDLDDASAARTNLGLGSAAESAASDFLAVASNLSDLDDASAARTNLGLGSAAESAASDFLAVASNLSDLDDASAARTNLGLGSAAESAASDFLAVASNLSDLDDAASARTNLGLGSAAESAASDFLAVASNLSDLDDAASARTNLGLGSAAESAASDFLAVASNLSDLNDASAARTNLGLGSAAEEDVGTAAGNVVQLDGSAKLPAVNGSQLTNLTVGILTDRYEELPAQSFSEFAHGGLVAASPTRDIQTAIDATPVGPACQVVVGPGSYSGATVTIPAGRNNISIIGPAAGDFGGTIASLSSGRALTVGNNVVRARLVNLQIEGLTTISTTGTGVHRIERCQLEGGLTIGAISATIYIVGSVLGNVTINAGFTGLIIIDRCQFTGTFTNNTLMTRVLISDSAGLASAPTTSAVLNGRFQISTGANLFYSDGALLLKTPLSTINGLTAAADRLPYYSGASTAALATFTAFGRSLVDDADASAARTTLGLGTAATQNSTAFQPADATLTALAGVATAANKLAYFTGVDTSDVTSLTSAGREIIGTASSGTSGQVLTSAGAGSSPTWETKPWSYGADVSLTDSTKKVVVGTGGLTVSQGASIATAGWTTTGCATGEPVYASGASTVSLADADNSSASKVIGVVAASGEVVHVGPCDFHVDAGGCSAGDRLYASPTAGRVTATSPSTAGQYVAPLGIALESIAANGTGRGIFMREPAILLS
jgi:hypothetical protein